jgi:hypothetical protein
MLLSGVAILWGTMSSTRSSIVCVTLAAMAGLAGCTREPAAPPAPPPAPPFKVVATVKEIMLGVVIPTSNVVFAAAGETPPDDAAWSLVETSTLALAESGNLLMLEGRAVDEGEWRKQAQALIATSEAALVAIRAKDADKLSAASDAIYEVCEACHKQYLPKQ